MQRRSFLASILAVAFPPAIVHASNMMAIKPVDAFKVIYGDGIHDDTDAIQSFINGEKVYRLDSLTGLLYPALPTLSGYFHVSKTLVISDPITERGFHDCSLVWTNPVDVGIRIEQTARGKSLEHTDLIFTNGGGTGIYYSSGIPRMYYPTSRGLSKVERSQVEIKV